MTDQNPLGCSNKPLTELIHTNAAAHAPPCHRRQSDTMFDDANDFSDATWVDTNGGGIGDPDADAAAPREGAAAVKIQAHVRGFNLRNRRKSMPAARSDTCPCFLST